MCINNYKIFDWKGKTTNEEMMILTKKQANMLFECFQNGNKERITELEKLVDGEFELDYSVDSIDNLNIWLFKKINDGDFDKFVKRFDKDGEISEFYRSLANDVTIYLFKVHEKQGKEMVWIQERYSSKKNTFNNWIGFSIAEKKIPHYETQKIYNYIKLLLKGEYKNCVISCLFDRKLILIYQSKLGGIGLEEIPPISGFLLNKVGYNKNNAPVRIPYTEF